MLLRICLARSSMFGHAQQMEQGRKSWIQVEQLAAARHFDAIALSIGANHAWFGVGGELLNNRKLPGVELGSERFQNWREILVDHRGEIRLIVARQQGTERSGASERRAILVRFNGGEGQCARRRQDQVTVRESVVVLHRKPSLLRLD